MSLKSIVDKKTEVFGNIASLQTLLERYPVLITTNSLWSIINGNSINFTFDLLKVIGVDNTAIVNWASKLLAGNGETGWLDIVERIIKDVLLLNIQSMLSCSINPIIPDELMDWHEVQDGYGAFQGITTEGAGISFNIADFDFNNMLKVCPTDKRGSFCYFDTDYSPNDLYKSRDFNAFLWYCINKGVPQRNTSDSESPSGLIYEMMWDNRNNVRLWKKEQDIQEKFLDATTPSKVDEFNDDKNDYGFKKKQVMQCQYIENDFPNNRLKIQIASNSYYKKYEITEKIKLNKTLFEFNYDYINSIKLFDTKVIVAQLIDKLTGSLRMTYSIEENMQKAKLGSFISKIIESDDTSINECFFTFSNQEYDEMLQKSAIQQAGKFKFKGDQEELITLDDDTILNELTNISSDSSLVVTETSINNFFNKITDVIIAQNSVVEQKDKFNFGLDIIKQIILEIATVIVEAILSPKVMILLLINYKVMGNDIPRSFDELLQGLLNLIIQLIRALKDALVNELLKFLMEYITPLIKLYLIELVLESVKFYRELLANLIELMRMAVNTIKGQSIHTVIDPINYADIVPVEDVPKINAC